MLWHFNNALPIYTQLVEQIRRAIAAGELEPGARLASVRDLSLEAGVNPNTMQKALTELERGGLIYSQRTAGHFVTQEPGVIEQLREDLADAQTRQYLNTMQGLGFSPEETERRLLRQLKSEGSDAHANSEL